jgi:hypothetical protein
MNRALAYMALSKALAAWREIPLDRLIEAVDRTPTRETVEDADGSMTIEVGVSWTDAKATALRISAVAYGPAHWHTERLAESCIVHRFSRHTTGSRESDA